MATVLGCAELVNEDEDDKTKENVTESVKHLLEKNGKLVHGTSEDLRTKMTKFKFHFFV